ncbi:hypothetical protein JR065_06025 [Xanthomonas sp. AmX2]|uniref:hypothetical protein n=1 Tax=Xanthomonas sp. TaxID=29446 RepID=UPI001981E478|nr:hypothetical protein [Xanthomonas sp.]MBN6149889.1 hypothetical protein [Xanthomonas sp.]
MPTRCRTQAASLPPRCAAAATLLLAALTLAGCGGEPAASQAQAQAEAPAPVHDALQRPQLFRDAFAELKARPELTGRELKVFQYVFFHDDGTVMLKVQNPQRPGQLDHYEYRPAGSGRPTPAWDGPHVFARDRDPAELAPQLIRLDEVPLQALPAVDKALDRHLEGLKALHPEQRENLELADGDRSIYFVVGGSDGERRWESKVNALYAWPMSAYRFGFSPDGSFYILEEIPPPR